MQPGETSGDTPRIAWNDAGELEVLCFDMGGQTFALEAVAVREILDLMPETVIPFAPPLAASVVNFRGKIVPVADLRLAFGMEPAAVSTDSRIVVVEIDLSGEATMIGLKTDKVHEVATFANDNSEDAPVVGLRWRRDYARKLVRHGGDIVVLLDLHRILEPLVGQSNEQTH